jgi:hypothetical protein
MNKLPGEFNIISAFSIAVSSSGWRGSIDPIYLPVTVPPPTVLKELTASLVYYLHTSTHPEQIHKSSLPLIPHGIHRRTTNSHSSLIGRKSD